MAEARESTDTEGPRAASARPKSADFGTSWQRSFIRTRTRTQPAMGEATQKSHLRVSGNPAQTRTPSASGPEPRRAPLVKVPEASAFRELHFLAESRDLIALAPTTNLTPKPLPLAAQWGCALGGQRPGWSGHSGPPEASQQRNEP